MPYVDSNVFIYSAAYDPKAIPEAARARRWLGRMAKGEVKEACTSALTWDEVVWVVARVAGRDAAIDEGRLFLRAPNLRLLPVNEGVALKAQEVYEAHRFLKPRDCIHAAAAIESGGREIVSFDPEFDKVDGLRRVEP